MKKDLYGFAGFIDMLCELNSRDEIEQTVWKQIKKIDKAPPSSGIHVPNWDDYTRNVHDI
ncbi:MAG: hypothetical protein QNK30_13815 [Bacteroidales bacterium]|nr:hypothetical protein [Bacteroidales bacterium]